jgi:hypothetical protein
VVLIEGILIETYLHVSKENSPPRQVITLALRSQSMATTEKCWSIAASSERLTIHELFGLPGEG